MGDPAYDIDAIANGLVSVFSRDQLLPLLGNAIYSQYADDPIGFGENILGESYTEDVKKLMLSVRDNVITIARSANATGKSQPVETPVLTPSGFIPIGDIKVGDFVFGRNGEHTRVTAIFPQGLQPTYRITFNDGSSTLCSGDHLWATRSSSAKGKGSEYQVMTTVELSKILHRYMHIPMCNPVMFQKKDLLVDPYVVGVMIGDGTLGQAIRFDSPDIQIVEKITEKLPGADVKLYRKTHYGVTTKPGESNWVLDAFRHYGLIGCSSNDKFIPFDYLHGDVDQRKSLLAGLMDTDGYIDKNSFCEYDTASEQLSKDVVFLVQSLGGTAKVCKKIPYYTHNGERKKGQLSYRIHIKIPFCPFTLDKKKVRWRDPETMQKQAHRIVKSISRVEDRDSVCIKVENKDALYITEQFIVTHNTHGAARVAAWFYKTHDQCQVYTAAAPPEDNLKKLLWGEIGSLCQRHKDLFAGDDITSLNIQKSPLEFITGVTIPAAGTHAERVAKFSGKHSKHLMFILDEGDAIPDAVYEGIESCMSGGTIVRMLIMFNPRSESGEVYRMEREGRANVVELSAFNHPNVLTGEDRIPGAVTREVTVTRINEWCRPKNESEKIDRSTMFKLPAFLEGATATRKSGGEFPPLVPGWYVIMTSAFSYMVLGQYPAQGTNQLISREWIDAARRRWDDHVKKFGEKPPRMSSCIMGQDVAEEGGDYNVSCFRHGGYVERFIVGGNMWNGVDLVETGDRATAGYRKRNCKVAYVDGIGVGAGVAPHMRRLGCNAHSVKSSERPTRKTEMGEFNKLRDQLAWQVREWLRTDPNAMLPPDDLLIEEMKCITYSMDSGKVRILEKKDMKEVLKRSPDRFDALAITFADIKTPKPYQGIATQKRSEYVW